MMGDMSKDAVKRYRPAVHTDGAACMVDCKIGFWVSKPDYDALAAKLADAERVARYETDIAQQALDQMRAAEAKLAEADAMIEAQQKDYASNNVRFAEAEHRAKAAEAKLAKVEEDRDDALIALASARKQLERYIGEAEAERVAANDLRKRKRTFAKLRGATTPKEPN